MKPIDKRWKHRMWKSTWFRNLTCKIHIEQNRCGYEKYNWRISIWFYGRDRRVHDVDRKRISGSIKIANYDRRRRSFRVWRTFFKWRLVIKEDIQTRLLAVNRCIGVVNKLLTNKIISRKESKRAAVLFGCKTWTLREEERQRLEVWDRKSECELFPKPNIVGVVKLQNYMHGLYNEDEGR